VRGPDLRQAYGSMALAGCMLANILLTVGAIYIVTRSPAWLWDHPVSARHAEGARSFLIGAIPPSLRPYWLTAVYWR
jgi:hypothetical protein